MDVPSIFEATMTVRVEENWRAVGRQSCRGEEGKEEFLKEKLTGDLL